MSHDLSWLYGPVPELTLLQRLKLRVLGNVYVGTRQHAHGTVEVYMVHCRKHGDFVDFRHGFDGYFLCPQCLSKEF